MRQAPASVAQRSPVQASCAQNLTLALDNAASQHACTHAYALLRTHRMLRPHRVCAVLLPPHCLTVGRRASPRLACTHPPNPALRPAQASQYHSTTDTLGCLLTHTAGFCSLLLTVRLHVQIDTAVTLLSAATRADPHAPLAWFSLGTAHAKAVRVLLGVTVSAGLPIC